MKIIPIEKYNCELVYDEVNDKLGSGSFGQVYKACKYELKDKQRTGEATYVALKRVPNTVIKLNEKWKKQLQDERRVLEQLNNQNITRLVAFQQTTNALYFVLEMCNCGNLSELLRARRSFTEAEV